VEEELSVARCTGLNRESGAEPRSAQYWAVFLQPLPEAGERIIIALVFRDVRGRPWIEFDHHFMKALTLYPDVDSGTLRFYLESLQHDLDASDNVEAVLNSYGPQLAVSGPRRIASPISRQVTVMLLGKYVHPSRKRSVPLVPGAENYAREHYWAGLGLRHSVGCSEWAGSVDRPAVPNLESLIACSGQQGRDRGWSQPQRVSTVLDYANA
jgi:hypothetical protein